MSEPTTSASAGPADPPEKSGRWRRLGCALLAPLWFLFLMMPCALIYLAVNGEIRIGQDGVPDPYAQPRLLISLISEIDLRGLRIETSSVFNPAAAKLKTCVQTDVRFLLWHSQGGDQDVAYCACYERADEDAAWAWRDTRGQGCAAPG